MPGIVATLAPLDSGFATAHLLQRWSPQALLSLEGELWPSRFDQMAARGIPVLMLGARMSARSARLWGRFGGLARRMLARVRHAAPQDAQSGTHLLGLGLNPAALGPSLDLKVLAQARRPAPIWRPRSARAGWLLAASTHEGEDAAVIEGFMASGLAHLILAPRHPTRAPAIAALLTARGLAFGQRSTGAMPGAERVFLADTLGEMDLWYAACGLCLVGGTLAHKGGHTPWEPVRHGCALLHGPSVWNFSRAFADLGAAGAAVPVTTQTLGPTLSRLDATAQDRLANQAARLLQAPDDGGALIDRILAISRL
jgi:3-deoxy-D-manno-octulosonic-acid transferase